MAVRPAALVSDKSALETCSFRCAIQIDDLYPFYLSLTWKLENCDGYVWRRPKMRVKHRRLLAFS